MSGMGEALSDALKGMMQVIGCLLLIVLALIIVIIVLVVKVV